jgi:CBS domain-containing protein
MLIKQVMDKTAAVCVPFDTVKAAVTIMKRNNIDFIPVVENELTHMYMGAVTDRILCLRVIGEGLDPEKAQLSACLSYQSIFCSPEDPIEKARQTMRRKRMDAMAVLDDRREVVGVVSLDDLLRRTSAGQRVADSPAISRKQRTSRSTEDARPRLPSGVQLANMRSRF